MKLVKQCLDRFEHSFPLFPIVTLYVVGFILYLRSIFNAFVGDDYYNILQNELVHHLYNVPLMFTADPLFNNWPFYRPLMYAFFALIYSIFGDQAGFYHLADLLLHIVNAALLFIFLKKVFSLQKFHFPQALAFILSLIFLIHPVNVEAVAYIAVTQDLMLVFLLLLGLLLTDYYCKSKTSIKIIFSIHLLVLACLLCKESGIIATVLIPGFCYLVYRKLNKTIISFGLTPLIIYFLMRLRWDEIAFRLKYTVIPIHRVDLPTRLTTFPYEVASYVRLIFFPKDLYMFQQDVISRTSDPRFYWPLIVTIVTIAIIVWLYFKYKSRLLTFFLLWVAVSCVILSNIVVTLSATVAERWMYMPLVGVLGFIGLVVVRLINHKKTLLFLVFITAVFIPLAMIRTYTRIGDWHDGYSLISHDISYAKSDPNAYDSYALELLQKGNIKGSIYYLKQALRLQSDNIQIKIHLGMALVKNGNKSEARELFYEMLADKSNLPGYDYIAGAYVNADINPNPNDVVYVLRKPLKIAPDDVLLNKMIAIAYARKNDWKSASIYTSKVYSLDPSAENLVSLNKVGSNLLCKYK